MLLRLQHFSFEIYYRKGNDIVFTDHLSRNMIDGTESNEMAQGLHYVCNATVSEELNVNHTRLEIVHEATACYVNM